jgi:hypothetical protein
MGSAPRVACLHRIPNTQPLWSALHAPSPSSILPTFVRPCPTPLPGIRLFDALHQGSYLLTIPDPETRLVS